MVGELARVTRRGGIVAGLNEGTRALYRSGENPEQEHEKELGINEHVHTMWAYSGRSRAPGCGPSGSITRRARPSSPPATSPASCCGSGAAPATLWALNAYAYSGLSLYARRR